jgi:hypothetical protein
MVTAQDEAARGDLPGRRRKAVTEDLAGRLRELAEMRTSGALTEQEFVAGKAMLLYPSSADAPGAACPPTPPAAPVAPPAASVAAPPVRDGWQPRISSIPVQSAQLGAGNALARPGRGGRQGPAATMAAGGLLALLAFFAMPMAQVPFLASITGADLAGLPGEAGAVRLLWLVPIAAATVAGLAAWLLLGSPPVAQARRAAGSVVLLAVAVLLAYLIAFAAVQNGINETGTSSIGVGASDLTGAGFWVTILGMLVALIGGGAYLRTCTS